MQLPVSSRPKLLCKVNLSTNLAIEPEIALISPLHKILNFYTVFVRTVFGMVLQPLAYLPILLDKGA